MIANGPPETIELARGAGPAAAVLHRTAAATTGRRRIAFVHGLAAPWTCWLAMQIHWRVPSTGFFLDMPWGTLGPDIGENWPVTVDDAVLMSNGLGLLPQAPDVLIAHSFGAMVVLEAVARGLTDPPAALVLVSPFYRASPSNFQWETLSYYVNEFHLVLEEGIVACGGKTRRPKPAHLHDMALKVRERVGACGWMHFFRAYMATAALRLGSVDMPVLVLGGSQDISAFPDDARSLASVLPNAVCKIFDAVGHFPFLEIPETFASTIEDFLASIAPASTPAKKDLTP